MVCPICQPSLALAAWQQEGVLLAEVEEQLEVPFRVLRWGTHPLEVRVEEEDLQEELVARSVPHRMRVEEEDLQEELVAR